MSMSQTRTRSDTYTSTDIAAVLRRLEADLIMIAQSTGAITEAKARDYAHDCEALAQAGYLSAVDLTLLSGGVYGVEAAAAVYEVNDAAGGLASSRPGGVLWPRVDGAYLRIVLYYTDDYDQSARARMSSRLKIDWSPSTTDTRHLGLNRDGGRAYVSGGYGLQRSDFR
jgi:hypothetical protein